MRISKSRRRLPRRSHPKIGSAKNLKALPPFRLRRAYAAMRGEENIELCIRRALDAGCTAAEETPPSHEQRKGGWPKTANKRPAARRARKAAPRHRTFQQAVAQSSVVQHRQCRCRLVSKQAAVASVVFGDVQTMLLDNLGSSS